jgi:hypothetical protein
VAGLKEESAMMSESRERERSIENRFSYFWVLSDSTAEYLRAVRFLPSVVLILEWVEPLAKVFPFMVRYLTTNGKSGG